VSSTSGVCDFLPFVADVTTFVKQAAARKGFTLGEDLRLSQLVQLYGCSKWERIAPFMNGRSARQCRERWRTVLSPGLTNGPWSHAEDELLVRLYREFGPKWSKIAKHFNGRSDCNVKNRWSRHLMNMNLDYMNREQLTDGSAAAFDFHEPGVEVASLDSPFEFIFGDQVDNCTPSTGGFINW
jgi:hypothetical protein